MIELPFPPSSLSGHANGVHWRRKAAITKKWRAWSYAVARAAGLTAPAASGDIVVVVRFYPPDRRSDRLNFPNRMKPIYDGIAQAMGVNDSRFVPRYEYHDPVKPGRVEISL